MTAPKVDLGSIPDLELPAAKPRTSASPSTGASAASNPPASTRKPATGPPPHGDARALDIGIGNDDDDWDMEIERDGGHLASLTSAPPTRTSSSPSYRRMPPVVSSTGLDVAYDRRETFERDEETDAPSTPAKVLANVAALVFSLGTVFACVKFVHRAKGIEITSLLPHAFDATSAPESGAVALGMLVLAIAIGTGGIMLRPRSWIIVTSAAPMLLMSLAMVTVALTATDENPAPPDGARLIPYLVPLSILLLGVGILRQSAHSFTKDGARRFAGLPPALIAGGLLFLAIEVSQFASRLP